MIHFTKTRRWALILAGFALLVAACGTADSDEPAGLPINDNPTDTPAASGACLPDEPDCVDTGVVNDEPLPLPSDEPVDSSGALAGGGLTVTQALTTDAVGVIAVQGFLFDDGSGALLCEVLAESFPPQCGGASIPVVGYEEAISVPISSEQGVIWTDAVVAVLGEIVDGTLVVDPTVAG